MSLSLLISLVLCNMVWSANPVMAKLILEDFSPVESAWLRYGSALLAYLVVLPWVKTKPKFLLPRKAWDWFFALGAGLMPFVFSPLLQFTGLQSSKATDNALIIAMEPLFTVFLAWLFLRARISLIDLFAFAVALGGFALLTGITPEQLRGALSPHLVGNLMILLALVGEASYTVFTRKLMDRFGMLGIFGTAIAAGAITLTLILLFTSPGAFTHVVTHMSWRSFFGVLWLGPMGTTAAYLFWLYALKRASVASVALTLFVQPVCGAIWGAVFLNERMLALQAVGGALILFAVAVPVVKELTAS